MTKEQRAFWDSYRATLPEPSTVAEPATVDMFVGTEEGANTCAQLVRRGKKTATCSLKVWYDRGLERLPRVGDTQIVTDWEHRPVAVIRTKRVDTALFSEVDEEFAAAEGEGDRSLSWWRDAHEAFFRKECAELGISFHPDMELVLERFEMVFPALT